MTTKYSIQSLAYLKIILHSAKFPSSAITGILLGYFEKDENLIIISDVIPLLHHWNDLSPIMELALQLVSRISSLLRKLDGIELMLLFLFFRLKFIVNLRIC